jgi:hypothetical protein
MLPEADFFSFAFLSKPNEKKSHLCGLRASAVKNITDNTLPYI